jgi:hypothetical protein
MLRAVEIALVLAPFVAFVLWRVLAPVGGPSPRVLAAAACALAVLAGALIWLRQQDSLPATEAYVPARLEGGQIVPGHGTER